jgi:hypothetical protein
MTTKRTPLRRTHHASRALAAWEVYLLLGSDYFHDLDRLGLDADEIERQAPLVWREHAQRFLTIWRSEYGRHDLPYGARQWGVPDDN